MATQIFEARRKIVITWIHVSATDCSKGENKGGVSKAVAESGDSEAVVNTEKVWSQTEQDNRT